MSSLNKVCLLGNLGKDPEIRSTQDGREVANFTIATSDVWTDKATGERKERTEWHRISCFNPGIIGVIRNYLKKGSKVYVEGSLQTRKWIDKEGVERYATEIAMQGFNAQLILLSEKQKEQSLDHQEPIDNIPESDAGF